MEHPELLVELGAILVGLAILSRLAMRAGIPTIPLYLTAGLAFGEGGVVPFITAEEFVQVGAQIGLILLLFMLGLQYTARDLVSTLRTQTRVGVLDFVLNFTPGVVAGFLLGWDPPSALLLGGVTYVTSTGIVAKILSDHGWTGNRETPIVIATTVFEDLTMALYLPVVGALLVGSGAVGSLIPAVIGAAVVAAVLLAAVHIEVGVSRVVFSRSDEGLLLTILGMTILVAGSAELFGISAAVTALVLGIVLSGPAAEAAQGLLAPLRDLFAAIFFAFVGLSVDPSMIPPVVVPAAILAVVTAVTKFATGWFAAAWSGIGKRGRTRAGVMLMARGEFSIALAGLAATAGVIANVEALAVSYVFMMALIAPVLARFADPVGGALVGEAPAR